MRKKQSGIGLSGLLVSAVILAMAALVGMKVVPEYIEYFQIVKAVKKAASDPGSNSSVKDARSAFERAATIDNISAISAADLEVTKEGDRVVMAFEYERQVHLFANISLLIEFEGSSEE